MTSLQGSCGEHFDRDNLDVVGAQLPLLKAVLETNKKVVVVLIHGRTVTFGAGWSDGYDGDIDDSPTSFWLLENTDGSVQH